jgi:hypothetical protein
MAIALVWSDQEENLMSKKKARQPQSRTRRPLPQERGVTARPKSSPPREPDDTVDADQLGRHFLKGAVQDPRPLDRELVAADEIDLEPVDPDDPSDTPQEGEGGGGIGQLTTEYPDRTEHEAEVSERALRQVRRERQGRPRDSDDRAIHYSKDSSKRRDDDRSSHPG